MNHVVDVFNQTNLEIRSVLARNTIAADSSYVWYIFFQLYSSSSVITTRSINVLLGNGEG